jgi:hypothetical protein
MQNLGIVYICWSPFVMSRTDAQNVLDMVFDIIFTMSVMIALKWAMIS